MSENADLDACARRRKPAWLNWKFFVAAGVLASLCLALGLRKSRARSTPAEDSSLATVAAARVMREDLANEMPLPAEFRPYVEVELHAKVSGYLDKMNVDFGDKVKSNQLLATIEVPELQDQLQSALAMQLKAEVDYTNANLMYSGLHSVNAQHANLVAQHEPDTSDHDRSWIANISNRIPGPISLSRPVSWICHAIPRACR
jgi:multidrug efflux pump subunit AcrA (membrane-fusion protein)